MGKGLFKKISAAIILAMAFTVIIPASFAKMSDFSKIPTANLISQISNTHEDDKLIHVQNDGDDIVITNGRNEELYRLQGTLPLMPASERRLVESGFDLAKDELEKLLEAYTS